MGSLSPVHWLIIAAVCCLPVAAIGLTIYLVTQKKKGEQAGPTPPGP